MNKRDVSTRRQYLRGALATALLPAIAGCNAQQTDSSESTTETTTATTTDSSDRAPRISSWEATPRDDGQVLAFHLEGRDDRGLRTAVVSYGDKTERTDVEGKTVTLNGEFTDLQQDSLSDGPGRIQFRLVNTAGQETTTSLIPDETAPELLTFSAEPTENAGEISLQLEGRDDVGLEHAAALLEDDPQFEESVPGQQEYSTDGVVDVSDDTTFQQNAVTASLEDWNGNATERGAETYVRKYDVMEDTRMDVGAETFSLGQQMFTDCLTEIETTPAVGVEEYGTPPTTSMSTRHIDQMTGFGVNRVNLTFGTGLSKPNIRQFLESPIINHIDVSVEYSIKPDKTWSDNVDSWKDDIVKPHMEFIRKNILSRDNVATYNGRPQFTVSNASGGWLPESQRNRIKEEWGSYANFVDDIRTLLTVDGTEPFITATLGGWGLDNYSNKHAETLAAQMDAVRNQKIVTLHDDNRGEWDTTLRRAEASYSGHRAFAEENNLEFVPLVGPGFDDRANTCWGPDRFIPRSQSGFQKLLALAEKYATIDRIDIATWNDWTEGTQIEPGSYRGKDYGTAYLEIIEQFQQPD